MHRKHGCPVVFGLVVVMGWIVATSHATTLRKLSLQELTGYADTIIVGKCEKKQAVWMEKRVITISTIRVSHSAKGDHAPGNAIEVHTLGGRVDNPLPIYMMVPGAEHIAEGEEMLLFLQKYGNKKQFHRLVGMAQGKLPVTTDAKTGKKQVHSGEPIKGVQWVDKTGKPVAPGTVGAQEAPAEPGDLDGFLGRIHKIQKEHGAKGGGR